MIRIGISGILIKFHYDIGDEKQGNSSSNSPTPPSSR